MRCDQHMGLPDEALQFLLANAVHYPVCPTCGHDPGFKWIKGGSYSGMFEDEYPLKTYALKDGGVAREFLQTAPWSSGPVHFLGLKIYDKDLAFIRDILWTEDEVFSTV